MKTLKYKITQEIESFVSGEISESLNRLEEEKEKYKHGDKKISKFNYFKINYENFKNKDINLNEFLLNSFLTISPFLMLNGSLLKNDNLQNVSIPQFFCFLVILGISNIMTFSFMFMLNISEEKTIAREKLEKAISRIEYVKNKMKITNNEISNVFNKEVDLNKILDLSLAGGEKISVFNRPVSADLINEMKKCMSEEQIVSVFCKSKSENITYKSLIESIKEVDFHTRAKGYYKEIFSSVKRKNKLMCEETL